MQEAQRRGIAGGGSGPQQPPEAQPLEVPDRRTSMIHEAVRRGLMKPQDAVNEIFRSQPVTPPVDINAHPVMQAFQSQVSWEGRPQANIPAMPEDMSQFQAATQASLKGNPAYAKLSPEQQGQAATQVTTDAAQRGQVTPDRLGDINTRAERAIGRLKANKYNSKEEQDSDLALVDASNQVWHRQRLMGRTDDPSEYIPLGMAEGASLGLGKVARTAIMPEDRGLEAAAAEQSPLGFATSTLAGGAIGGLGVGKLGATATRAALEGMGVAGQKLLGIGSVAGGWLGGQLAGLPGAVGTGIQEDHGAGQIAKDAALQTVAFPMVMGKVFKGEELNEGDRLVLAMGILNLAGAGKDVAGAMKSLPRQVAERMNQNIDAVHEMIAANPNEAQARFQEALSAYGGEGAPESHVTTEAPKTGDAQPQDLNFKSPEGAAGTPPETASFRKRAAPPEPRTPRQDKAREKLLSMAEVDKARLRKAAVGRPEADFVIKEMDALEAERFTEKPGQKVDVETQGPGYANAMRARKYTPDSYIHQTSIDALEGIAKEGLQAGSANGASGIDTGIFASKTNAKGELVAPSYGRDKVPVALELSKNVKGGLGKGGDFEVNSEGKGYVRPEDIAGVYVGKDPHRYTLQEAVERVKKLSSEPAKPVAPEQVAKPQTLRAQRTEANYAKSKTFLEGSPELGPRELSRKAGIPYTSAQRHVQRFRSEQVKAQAPQGEIPPGPSPESTPEPTPSVGADESTDLRARLGQAIRIAKEHRADARTDPLTKLANRKGQDVAAKRLFARADKKGQNVAVTTFDLSNFKALNDVHGHEAGDEALRIIADELQKAFRGKQSPERGRTKLDLDVAGVATRPGGDEFNALLYGVKDDAAARVAIDRIEASVQKALDAAGLGSIKTKSGERKVSLIGGHSLRKAGDTQGFEGHLAKADEASIGRKSGLKKARGEPEGRFDLSETEGIEQARNVKRAEPPKETPPPQQRKAVNPDEQGTTPKPDVESFLRRWDRVSEFDQVERKALIDESAPGVLDAVREHLDKSNLNDPHLRELLGMDERSEGPKPKAGEEAAPPPRQGLMDELRNKGGSTVEAQRETKAWLETLSDEELSSLKGGARGSNARLVAEEIKARAGGSGMVGSPRRPRPNTSPENTTSPIRLRSALRQNGRATVAAQSPHEIISRLSKDLGLSWPGVGAAKALKKWALGFYRVNPESIRLRLADDLDTHIHEIGHHLQKMLFQGGETFLNTSKGKRLSATGLRHGMFPASWNDELMALGRRLYGPRQPAAGYAAEGWAELVRHAFTGDNSVVDINGKPTAVFDMQSYKDMLSMLARDWHEQYAALNRFKDAYVTYRDGSPVTKLAGYIRRNTSRDPQTWTWTNRLRTALTDRFHALSVMKGDLGLAVAADQDPHTVALRAFGRATGDMKRAMRYGRFNPNDPTRLTGPSLESILSPVKDNMPEFESYLFAKRALEKRGQGVKGIAPNLSDADIKAALKELDAVHPAFTKASEEFQKFNQWLIRDYAVGHGLITPEVAQKIIAKNLDYVTFRRVLAPDQGKPGSTTGAPNRYVETGTGIRRLPKDLAGLQIDPPVESFLMSMQGIMHRAEMNRVGQTIVKHFGVIADYESMPRWRLDTVAEEHGIDSLLPRPDIIAALKAKGIRVSQVEGMGRWIDSIDRPMDANRVAGTDVSPQIKKMFEDMGIDVTDPAFEAMLQLIDDQDFMSFRPGTRVDKRTRQFSVLVNGKPTFWEAKNDGLFRLMEGFENPAAVHGFMKFLALPRLVYRAGATALNPDFFIANFFRDTFHAMVVTDVDKSGGLTGFSARTKGRLKGMYKAFLTGDPGQMFLASGADMSGLFGEYIDPKTKSFKLDRMFENPHKLLSLRGKGLVAKTLDAASTAPVWRFIERANQRFEMATRMAEFEAQLQQGDVLRARDKFGATDKKSIELAKNLRNRSDIEAAGQAAADVTLDFTRGGTAAIEINKYIPFFNAAFIGGDKLARYIRQNPYKAMGQIFNYIIAPSIASHMMNRNDRSYWNIPYSDRDRYWYFGMGDPDGDGRKEYLRIPKPYGLGAFSVAVERLMAKVDGIDPLTGARGDPRALDGLGAAMIREFRPPYYVPVILPALELYMNRSIWQDADIVRRGEQVGPEGERGAERSSEFARMLGGFMDIAPPKIDYAIQGFTAGMGTNVVQYGVDPMIRRLREDLLGYEPLNTKKPTNTQLEGWPIIKRLVAEEPKTYSETLIRFWNAFNEAESAYRGWSARKDNAKAEKEYYQQNQAYIEAYKNIIPYKNDINELFKEYRALLNDRSLSAEERSRRENKILNSIHKTAQQGMADVDRYKPKKK